MAFYIKLIDKKTNEATAFNKIDELLCKHLGVEVDAVKFYAPDGEWNWYDAIGWSCINKSLAQFSKELEEDSLELSEAIKWIDENYELDSWIGR